MQPAQQASGPRYSSSHSQGRGTLLGPLHSHRLLLLLLPLLMGCRARCALPARHGHVLLPLLVVLLTGLQAGRSNDFTLFCVGCEVHRLIMDADPDQGLQW
jgi:hypothetical protein